MSENINLKVEQVITRRTFLKGSLGVGVALLAVQTAGSAILSGCAAAPSPDITSTSSIDFNHSHNATIPGADIDNAPSEKTYTSDGASHTHAITLKKTDFETIKKGQQVSVVSTATGTTPHTHTFNIMKA
ncbi:MAG: hypothetical protein HYX79_10645 [Chloroflexi bacterium]|nr:hypothetical protein [Chloroflexota bacterium]